VTFTASSYTVNIPLTAYSDENNLENAVSAISISTGSAAHTHIGLAGAIAAFNSTTLRPDSNRVVVVILKEDWVNQYQVSDRLSLFVRGIQELISQI
jgi:von Willebrand factor type A domain